MTFTKREITWYYTNKEKMTLLNQHQQVKIIVIAIKNYKYIKTKIHQLDYIIPLHKLTQIMTERL